MIGQSERRQFINSLIEERVEKIKSVDTDIFSEDFLMDEYRNALHNAVKLFLLSRKGDRIRQPDYGGFFDKLLSEYDMDEEGARKVEDDLRKRLEDYFGEDLIIKEIVATPKPAEEAWLVGVTALDPITGMVTDARTQPILIKLKDKEEFNQTSPKVVLDEVEEE